MSVASPDARVDADPQGRRGSGADAPAKKPSRLATPPEYREGGGGYREAKKKVVKSTEHWLLTGRGLFVCVCVFCWGVALGDNDDPVMSRGSRPLGGVAMMMMMMDDCHPHPIHLLIWCSRRAPSWCRCSSTRSRYRNNTAGARPAAAAEGSTGAPGTRWCSARR